MGAGKTSALGEASDILAQSHIPHAAIDLDAFGIAYAPSIADMNGMMYRNLRCVCENYAAVDLRRVLLARAIEDRAELELCRGIVSASNTLVCRLTANIQTMEQRVKMRELGIAQANYVARVSELNSILDRARLEDFAVSTENRSVTEVALEMLTKAGWISK